MLRIEEAITSIIFGNQTVLEELDHVRKVITQHYQFLQ